MNILIVNQPLNNRGDESAHKALVRTILSEMPSVSICVLWIGANPDSIRQFAITDKRVRYVNIKEIRGFHRIATNSLRHPDLHFLNWLHPTFRNLISYYKKADWVVCAPGGICMGGFQNWMHLFILWQAKRMDKKIAYYGRSIGPFPTATKDGKIFKQISEKLLKSFKFLALRDKKSEAIAKKMGVGYYPTVDSAFLDSPHVDLPEILRMLLGEQEKYMVFVPNKLIWHYGYKTVDIETIFGFYQSILEIILRQYPDHKIVLLPQIFNVLDAKVADYEFFMELAKRQNDKRIIVVPDKYSSDIQQTVISGASFLIGARYHSIVFALNNNVPFIALSYEHKMSGLLETLDKQDCIVDITNTFDSKDSLESTVKSICGKLPLITKDEKVMNRAKDIAIKCFKAFKKVISHHN